MIQNQSDHPNISPELIALLKQAKSVLILCHHNPDGDAICSSVALGLALRNQDCVAHLHLAGSYADNLGHFLNDLVVDDALDNLSRYDLLVLLDCHNFDRMHEDGLKITTSLALMKTPPPVIIVDHHLLNPHEVPTPLWFHDPKASSTGEMIFYLLKVLGPNFTFPIIQSLLASIAADTGFFCQTNTTAKALAAASELVALGGNLEEVDRILRRDRPLRQLRLLELALATITLHFDEKMVIMEVDGPMLTRAGATLADTEGFVEIGRNLSGVCLSALIKTGDDLIKVSLRSRTNIDASSLANMFGGGGHRQAAAYVDTVATSLIEAKQRLLKAAETVFKG
ncbi:MAG: DHH family phosphoesterase [Candidatus Adiutrix sp.]